MAGYWPSSFLPINICRSETELGSMNKQKMDSGALCLAILSEQAWSIKDLYVAKCNLG